MEFTDNERLVIAQAIYGKLGELVSTKDPGNLRAKADEEYKRLYDESGAKSFQMRLNGQNVGTYSIRTSKAKPQEERLELVIQDKRELCEFISQQPVEALAQFAVCLFEQYAEWHWDNTGEVPNGCDIQTIITPAQEPSYLGGSLKVKPEEVAQALKGLDIGIAGLLEG